MNVLPGLRNVMEDIKGRFGKLISETRLPRSNEAHLDVDLTVIPGLCAYIYRRWNARLALVCGEDLRAEIKKYKLVYVFALDEIGAFLICLANVSAEQPEFTSLSNAIPAVNWQEREVQDMLGIRLIGHPNPRRCALHDDWPDVKPLRKDFDLKTQLPAFSGERHKFRKVEGEGVFQVPVGPVHAGIIEPGHFLFSVAGEPVLYLQIRLFYTHKGTEKLFENMPVSHGVHLAERISGDSSFAHATAFCHAVERAAGIEVPLRARMMRTICLELERLYNHIADTGAIATDVAFVVGNAHAMRLKEHLLRLNEELAGNRLLRGLICPGGMRRDWDDHHLSLLKERMDWLRTEFETMVDIIRNSTSTRDRLETTGVLTHQTARDLGVVGIAGRASGIDHDLRRDFPHAAYDQVQFTVSVHPEGDVLKRMQVRIDEVRQSITIILQLLEKMTAGEVRSNVPPLQEGTCALGYVEGWRGEIFHWIRAGRNNRLTRCKIKDPSLQNWPALSEAILDNIIPDFPVVNKSFNLSYSGTDR